ncbi:MAG: hypothetical protein KDJ73_04205 [Notoacmeibacter sp.]|nr:hypothetical protein [Notoacmeibacter sp.]
MAKKIPQGQCGGLPEDLDDAKAAKTPKPYGQEIETEHQTEIVRAGISRKRSAVPE